MRVLIVEDEARLEENIASALREGFQYIVDWAKDGETPLSLAQRRRYNVTVLDLMLPRMCGMEVLTRLRSAKSSIPVLILTASNDRAAIARSCGAGANDYLGKPFDLRELMTRIKALGQ